MMFLKDDDLVTQFGQARVLTCFDVSLDFVVPVFCIVFRNPGSEHSQFARV